MAKAKELPEGVAKGRMGAGWRYCEACDHSTKGPRSTACGNCGAAFVSAPKRTKAETKPRLAVETVPDFGKTAETLAEVSAWIKEHGGAEKVAKVLEDLEAIQKKTGGSEGLKAAMEALKKF